MMTKVKTSQHLDVCNIFFTKINFYCRTIQLDLRFGFKVRQDVHNIPLIDIKCPFKLHYLYRLMKVCDFIAVVKY